MNFMWYILFQIIPVPCFGAPSFASSSTEWQEVEEIAEDYPYVVAILNERNEYMCSGFPLDDRTVVTAGSCLTSWPSYVVLSAVLGDDIDGKNLLEVSHMTRHGDYSYYISQTQPSESVVNCNIALVYVVSNSLNFFAKAHFFPVEQFDPSQLRKKKLEVVGFGRLDSGAVALQRQEYVQEPCDNPAWYYCICGVESNDSTYENEFGEGGPVLIDGKVVGITAAPCGSLFMPTNEGSYNIFTMLSVYYDWISKPDNATFRQISKFAADANNVFTRSMRQMKALNRVGIVGVPFEKGQKKYGVSVGPAAMRFAGLIDRLKEIDGLDIKDYGDVETHSCAETIDRAVLNVENMSDLAVVSACNKRVSEKVSQVLRDDRIAVTIGGDHSIGIGTVDGHYNVSDDMILIWVDAHADLNTNKTSGSGSVHGMPVALLVKELSDYWPYLPTMDWQVPKFSIKSLGYLGLRSVDSYERLAIEKYDVPAFAMEDIDKHGIVNSINHVLQILDPTRSRPIHVSFDIDALDALEAPSTGTAVRGGLTLREGITLMEIVHATGRLRAIDLVEINPAVGSQADRDRTLDAGVAILRAALGFSRRGTAPHGLLDLPIQTPSNHNNHHK